MTVEKWFEIRKSGDFIKMGKQFGIDPMAARVMRNRGIESEADAGRYLYGSLQDLDSPAGLDGIDRASDIILEKIRQHKPIRVIGDYDIDGVCATCILVEGLSALGGDVSYDIPERLSDGYGLNVRLVKEAIRDGIDTLITVDNGISALSQIQLAKDAGMTVIVTDHHSQPYREEDGVRLWLKPSADVVIDPNLHDCRYPNKALCGAGVAWKLLYMMEARLQTSKGSLPSPEGCPLTMELLPFAAFATVGDVMDLKGENRILVKTGLRLLEKSDNIGMRALISACGLQGRALSAYHIGFVLGPCINAGGRLETAHEAVALFLSGDAQKARLLAEHLCSLNQERKELTDRGVVQAMAEAESEPLSSDKVLVIYLPGTHESIAGIIAGKVRERSGKPCFILTDAQEEGLLMGSGRSIAEYSMYDELVGCSDLLEKFGGHPMAAGLSLRAENLEEFRRRLNEACTLTEEDLARKVMLDARLPLSYISEGLVESLKLLEPFGKGNERPLFGEQNLSLLSCRVLGKRRNVLKLAVASGTRRMSAVCFCDADSLLQRLSAKGGEDEVKKLMAGLPNSLHVTAAFYPEVNEYRGNREIQICITNMK